MLNQTGSIGRTFHLLKTFFFHTRVIPRCSAWFTFNAKSWKVPKVWFAEDSFTFFLHRVKIRFVRDKNKNKASFARQRLKVNKTKLLRISFHPEKKEKAQ